MEVTREMTCPNCKQEMHVAEHVFFDLDAVIIGCASCKLYGVMGDDRLLDNTDFPDDVIKARLRKRADKLEENRKAAANRYVDVKR